MSRGERPLLNLYQLAVKEAVLEPTGHAEIEMITKVYAHILDEDRKINAQKFDSAFYSNPDLRQVKAPQVQGISAEQLLSQLKESPELASALAQLLAGGKAG